MGGGVCVVCGCVVCVSFVCASPLRVSLCVSVQPHCHTVDTGDEHGHCR